MTSEPYLGEVLRSIKLCGTSHEKTKPWEIAWLIWKARQTHGNILEVGCNLGETTFELAKAFPERIIIAVDYSGAATMENYQTNEQPTKAEFCKYAKKLKNVRFLDINSRDFVYSQAHNIGFAFIDGDHSYAGVRADSERAFDWFRGNPGIVAWHDYYPDHAVSVKAYLDQIDGLLGGFVVVHNTSIVYRSFK